MSLAAAIEEKTAHQNDNPYILKIAGHQFVDVTNMSYRYDKESAGISGYTENTTYQPRLNGSFNINEGKVAVHKDGKVLVGELKDFDPMSDDNLTGALETAGLRRSEFTVPLSFHEIPMPREPQRLNALRAVLEEDKAVQAIRVAGQEFIDLTGVVVAERADDYVKRRIAPREEQVGEYCIHHGNLAFVGNGTVGEKGHYYEGTYTPDNGVVRALEDAGLHRTGLGVAFSTGGHATNVTRASEEKIRSRVANARVSLARSC